jgi:uncharacterized protein YigE (DUF2233 family)
MKEGMVPARVIAPSLVALLLSVADAAATCGNHEFEGSRYTVCDFDPAASEIRVFWQSAAGETYRTFATLAEDLAADGSDLVFAMNGGMFAEDYSPIGLLIQNGEELAAANTTNISPDVRPVPNFYKKPNGVFFIGDGEAGILETARFLRERPAARFATQSGPLLVISGEIHPAFIVGSKDRTRRDGVGVCGGGIARFAISENPVNFHDFARFFRDGLGCQDALFLDGGWAPGIFAPDVSRNDWPGHGGYGPIIAVVRHSE